MAPLAGWGCGFMALISTSSTAYLEMASVLLLYGFYSVNYVSVNGLITRKTLSGRTLSAIGGIGVLLIIALVDRDLLFHFVDLIDNLIFQKHNTESYIQRSSWTAEGLKAFFESNGLGVGVGSVRTSNFFANILASTGILGASLFAIFLYVIFTRRALQKDAYSNVIMHAMKLSLIPIFVGMTTSGTTPDFGVVVGTIFGIIVGLGKPSTDQVPTLTTVRLYQNIP